MFFGGILRTISVLRTTLSAILLLFWAGFCATPVLANTNWQRNYIEKLRNEPVDYLSDGMICEQVARLEMEEEYSKDSYQVEVGLNYGRRSQVIGELDIVIFDRRTREAVLVGEVKCWNEPGQARAKGNSQRARFFEFLYDIPDLQIWRNQERFPNRYFSSLRDFVLIGPAGSRALGFDREMRLDLAQLRQLRVAMLECQKTGYCRRPGGNLGSVR